MAAEKETEKERTSVTSCKHPTEARWRRCDNQRIRRNLRSKIGYGRAWHINASANNLIRPKTLSPMYPSNRPKSNSRREDASIWPATPSSSAAQQHPRKGDDTFALRRAQRAIQRICGNAASAPTAPFLEGMSSAFKNQQHPREKGNGKLLRLSQISSEPRSCCKCPSPSTPQQSYNALPSPPTTNVLRSARRAACSWG